jgi:hypothetical protein
MYRLCSVECKSWFRKSESSLPKPLKPPRIGNVCSSFASGNLRLETARSDLVTAREDHRSYKNISIYVTELPPTPNLWVPRNPPPSIYQKSEGSSQRLPQTSERPDARTPVGKPTPRKSNQGASHRYYTPPSTSQSQTSHYTHLPTYQIQTRVNASMPAMAARVVNQNQSRSNVSMPVMAAKTAYQN